MANLRLDDLGKSFAPGIRAFEEVSLTVTSGECLALVGPSGCGKTTLLRVIAGLEQASTGTIHIDGVQVNDTPPHRREVALLLQRPALLLQQTVRQNLRLAWTVREPWALVRRWFGGERGHEENVLQMARLLDLEPELDRPVQQLSGGQQQRVALGRCLLRKAKILLLDEPLGHLDAPLRTDLRRQIRRLARELGLTVLHVTHDPAEALAAGDRVAVMGAGRILQIDEPRQLRRFPSHRFVAELIHHEDGGFNWLPGEIDKQEFDVFFDGAFGRWPLSLLVLDHLRESLYKADEDPASATGGSIAGRAIGVADAPRENFPPAPGKVPIMMGIPASQVRCTTTRVETDDVCLALRVQEIECSAAGYWVIGVSPLSVSPREPRWIGRADASERFERGQEVMMTFSMNQASWFDSASGRTLFAPAC